MATTSQPYGITIADDADVSAGIGTSTAISPTQVGLIPNLPFAGFILKLTSVGSGEVYATSQAFGGVVTSFTNGGTSANDLIFTFTSAQPNTNYTVYSGNVIAVDGAGTGIVSKTTSAITLTGLVVYGAPSSSWGAQGLVLFYPEDLR